MTDEKSWRTYQDLQQENKRLRAVEQAAHDLLCWTYQHAIKAEPHEYTRHVRDLHPAVYNAMNSAERDLYNALLGRPEAEA